MSRKVSVIDLNFEPNILHRAPCPRRLAREHWTHGLFTAHRFSTRTQIPPVRSPLLWRTTCSDLLMLGPVPLSGFRTIDLSREFTRYSHLLACTWQQTLPRRYSRAPLAQHFRRRERKTRLAHLCRFCTNPHRPGQRTLSEREPLHRTGKHCLCLRLNNRGSLPFFVSLGPVPSPQKCREASYAHRPAREYSLLHSHH